MATPGRLSGYRFRLVGVAVACAFWLLDSLVHLIVYREARFELIPSDFNEFWMRFVIFLLLIAFGWFADVHHTRLLEKNHLLERHRRELRNLSSQLFFAEERVRRTLAGALHDNVAQDLAGIAMMLGALDDDMTPQDAMDVKRRIEPVVQKAIRETRALIFEICPPSLYELGLKPALQALGEATFEPRGVRCDTDLHDSLNAISNESSLIAYQTVRELLHNVLKHARVDSVRVSGNVIDGTVVLEVQDAGVGFDTCLLDNRDRETGHFGLFRVKELVESHGGQVDIASSPTAGTRVRIRLPA